MNDFLVNLTPWLFSHGVRILIIAVVTLVVQSSVRQVIERLIRKAVVGSKREDTLIRIFVATIRTLIWIIVVLMILQEAGMDIAPLLAAAGIAGLAFGFGGQYLIRDLIAGLFIILENQYRVGDVVSIGGTSGLVEDISLRMTTLRDLDGTVHHVPHGEITQVSNLSKDYARVNLDIGVSYSVDLEKVITVINQVGNDLASDTGFKDKIVKAPQFLRVNDFADSAVMIKILGDVEPLKQWEVTGELRKRLKIAFDKEGIEIPFPQRVVHTVKN
ncbi:MAG: mechanosensitive ion channel family protein [bacterium]|nr:mechanosensitive ion channel family protein [bacterium]